MSDSGSRFPLPSAEAWERFKLMLPASLHERLARLRFLLESLDARKAGIDFELHMLSLEFIRELAARFAKVIPEQEEKFQKVVEASLKRIVRSSSQYSKPWWKQAFTYFSLVTILVVVGAAGLITQQIQTSEKTLGKMNRHWAQQNYNNTHEEAGLTRQSFENRISPNIEIRRLPAGTLQVWIPYGNDPKKGRWEAATIKEIPLPESIGR